MFFSRKVFQDVGEYSHFGVTRNLIDERTFYSNRGGTYLVPMYLAACAALRIAAQRIPRSEKSAGQRTPSGLTPATRAPEKGILPPRPQRALFSDARCGELDDRSTPHGAGPGFSDHRYLLHKRIYRFAVAGRVLREQSDREHDDRALCCAAGRIRYRGV